MDPKRSRVVTQVERNPPTKSRDTSTWPLRSFVNFGIGTSALELELEIELELELILQTPLFSVP